MEKLTYVHPASYIMKGILCCGEDILKSGVSIYNDGKDNKNEKDNSSENKDPDIEVDAKRNNYLIWEDED